MSDETETLPTSELPPKSQATIHDNERARKAVISPDGKVENIIVAANDFTMPGRIIVDAGDAEIGWLYINGVLTPPVSAEPKAPTGPEGTAA